MGKLLLLDALRTWVIPSAAGVVIVVAAALSATGLASATVVLPVAVVAALVLLSYVGMRPLLADDAPSRARGIGAALGVVWLLLLYVPFHTRIFPGRPIVDAVEVAPKGTALPLPVPAGGRQTLDLLVEGQLAHAANGAALPVSYSLTFEDADHVPQVVTGRFDETLRTQRLGRRGTTVVRQTHSAELQRLTNPTGRDLTLTSVTVEPEGAPPVSVTVFAHPLPGPLVLALVALALVAAVVAFDRLPALAASDGALTYATGAVLGAAVVFWTSNTPHPEFRSLVGAAIFGGPVGFGVGAMVWWIAKRVAPRER